MVIRTVNHAQRSNAQELKCVAFGGQLVAHQIVLPLRFFFPRYTARQPPAINTNSLATAYTRRPFLHTNPSINPINTNTPPFPQTTYIVLPAYPFICAVNTPFSCCGSMA